MPLTKKQIKNRKTLVDALRSGKYKQTKNVLRSKETKGFCCQGVACELFKDEVDGKWVRNNNPEGEGLAFKYGKNNFDRAIVTWPFEVMNDLLGIDNDDSGNLIRMNDGRIGVWEEYTLGEQCTFDEIADAIELLTLADL